MSVKTEKRICTVCDEVVKDNQEHIDLPHGQICHAGLCRESLRTCKRCDGLYNFDAFPNPDYCPDCVE